MLANPFVRVRNGDGETAIHRSVGNGRRRATLILLEVDPEPLREVTDARVMSLAQSTVLSGDIGMVTLLLKLNPKLSHVRNGDGNSLLGYAVWGGHLPTVKLLLEANRAAASFPNAVGTSPEDIAKRVERRDIMMLFADGNTHDP